MALLQVHAESLAGEGQFVSQGEYTVHESLAAPNDGQTSLSEYTATQISANLPLVDVGEGTVNSVSVVYRGRVVIEDTRTHRNLIASLRMGGSDYSSANTLGPEGTISTTSGEWEEYRFTWNTNPSTELPWESSDLADLQRMIARALVGSMGGGATAAFEIDHLFLEVDYTEEEIPEGTTYEITMRENISIVDSVKDHVVHYPYTYFMVPITGSSYDGDIVVDYPHSIDEALYPYNEVSTTIGVTSYASLKIPFGPDHIPNNYGLSLLVVELLMARVMYDDQDVQFRQVIHADLVSKDGSVLMTKSILVERYTSPEFEFYREDGLPFSEEFVSELDHIEIYTIHQEVSDPDPIVLGGAVVMAGSKLYGNSHSIAERDAFSIGDMEGPQEITIQELPEVKFVLGEDIITGVYLGDTRIIRVE